jgi:hypothetical protein
VGYLSEGLKFNREYSVMFSRIGVSSCRNCVTFVYTKYVSSISGSSIPVLTCLTSISIKIR